MQRREHVLERVRGMRIVDDDERPLGDPLHAARHIGQLRDQLRGVGEIEAVGDERTEHGERIGAVEATDLARGQGCAPERRNDLAALQSDERVDRRRRRGRFDAVADGAHTARQSSRELAAEGVIEIQHCAL